MTAVPYPRPLRRPPLSRPVTPLALLALITLLIGLVLPLAVPTPAPLPPTLTGLPYARTDSNVFIENRGQFADDLVAAMLAQKAQLGIGRDGRLHLTVTGAPPVTLTFSSEGFTPQPQVTLTGPLATRVSFLTGDNTDRHQADVPVWAGVRIAGLIPQLALELTVEDGRLRLRAAPDGAPNLGAVRLQVEGATVVGISDGTLEVQAGEHRLRLPLLEVDSGSAATPQAPTPTVLAQQEIGAPFAPLGAAGQAHSTAAPASVAHLLAASTFLGSPGAGSDGAIDNAEALALDEQGNVYVAGKAGSADFPTTIGTYDPAYNGSDDAFIAKLSGNMTTLIAATLLGGSQQDEATDLTLDAQGNVYVVGRTQSTNFPTTSSAYNRTSGNVFLAKLSSDLTTLSAATFLGQGSNAGPITIALDAQSNIYVTGTTWASDFPTTLGAYDRTHNGMDDAFVAKLSSDLTTLTAATFLGGSAIDNPIALVIDIWGNVYVAGRTWSVDFPTTAETLDATFNGLNDAFIARLSNDLTTLTAATFLGGSHRDEANALALDNQGDIYVAGWTISAEFPTTVGTLDTTFDGSNGFGDAFIARLSDDLTTLTAATFLGGNDRDEVNALALDTQGNVYVTGETFSYGFPTTTGAYDTTLDSGDAFVAKLSSDLTTLAASTFLGGSQRDETTILALDAQSNVYVAGQTMSVNFPTTLGTLDTTFNGSVDAFIARLNSNLTTLSAATFLGGSAGNDEATALALDTQGNVYVAGWTESAAFPTTVGAYDTVHNSSYDAFVARLSGDLTTLSAATFLGGSNLDKVTALTIDVQGNVYVAGETWSADFPTTVRAFDTTYNGGYSTFNVGDAFIAKLSNDLRTLDNATFLGGSNPDRATALALDAEGNVYVVGETFSADFPVSGYDRVFNGVPYTIDNGNNDAFIAKLSSDLNSFRGATFLGGSNMDIATALAVDAQGNVYVAGETKSADFPTTAEAQEFNGLINAFTAKLSEDLTTLSAATFLSGSNLNRATALALDVQSNVYVAGSTGSDAFVTKLNSNLTVLAATSLGGSQWDRATALAVDAQGDVYVAGETFSHDFPTTPEAFDTTYNGHYDAFLAKLSSDISTLTAATFLGGSDRDKATALAIYNQGTVYMAGITKSASFPTTVGAYDPTYGGGSHSGDAFIAKLVLLNFAKTAPNNNATGQSTSPSLQWETSGTTLHHYRYCIATMPGCTPDTSVGTATSVAASGLTPGATYHWQVRACIDSGCTVYIDADSGQHHSFTVATLPPPFTTPPGTAEQITPGRVTLSWEPVSGPIDHYRYCIDTAPGCMPDTSVGTATSVTIPLNGDELAGGAAAQAQQSVLRPGQTYYWLVRACADSECTVYTDANNGQHRSFIVRFSVYLPLTVR